MASTPYEFGAFLMPAAPGRSWWYTGLTAGQVGQNLAANKAVVTDVSAYIDVDNTVKFAVVMTASSQKSWWYPDLTAGQVGQNLAANKAVVTDVSAYIDVDNTVKFAVVMTASSQKSWWYPDLTAGQVGQNLAANKAVLTDVSAYIDVDNTVKFAVVMTASSQKSWWYPDLTADPDAVQQQLKANRAVLTAVSAYIDLDNTLKFAVVMTASNQQQWWWYTGFDSGEITGQVSNLKARVVLLAPHLPPMSGALRAAFISPDLYLGLTVSPDGVNWPTGFPGVGSTSSPYVSIGEPGQQPNAFGAPSLAYFGGAYWMAYVNVQPDTPAIWVASSADGISWSGWTAVTPNDPGALTHPVTAPSTAVFNGQLWLGFLEGPVYSPTASGVFPPAHTGRICVCSSSDCATWSATAQIAFPDPFELPADPLESSQPLPADDHVSVSAPALASFAGKLWLAFVERRPDPDARFRPYAAGAWARDDLLVGRRHHLVGRQSCDRWSGHPVRRQPGLVQRPAVDGPCGRSRYAKSAGIESAAGLLLTRRANLVAAGAGSRADGAGGAQPDRVCVQALARVRRQ